MIELGGGSRKRVITGSDAARREKTCGGGRHVLLLSLLPLPPLGIPPKLLFHLGIPLPLPTVNLVDHEH